MARHVMYCCHVIDDIIINKTVYYIDLDNAMLHLIEFNKKNVFFLTKSRFYYIFFCLAGGIDHMGT